RHLEGYYRALNNGHRASIALHAILEEEESDLVDETAPYLAMAAVEPEPTLQQALNGPDGIEWQEAVDYEISQLEKLGTWEVVNAP
ncbi:hypothetical protein P692DRAFT_20704442, partial [Suillus brevipes Sb2]